MKKIRNKFIRTIAIIFAICGVNGESVDPSEAPNFSSFKNSQDVCDKLGHTAKSRIITMKRFRNLYWKKYVLR